ncbi:hypothetical protein BLNAU_21664 [Blattamonas nauphoetae]|uniref:Uncharacterized protein n=1 Tax=Blattamonas nauphoetae TaxID=2049346 RepID=A0ABQ9WXH9_9EUKA|nr:hypothetical protein BLNAU_21664 [Blattamonas nauphoetae]
MWTAPSKVGLPLAQKNGLPLVITRTARSNTRRHRPSRFHSEANGLTLRINSAPQQQDKDAIGRAGVPNTQFKYASDV